ncbi:MAG TPA: DUF1150 family protein [Alphaproteobacteria bacterium]|nr:DUF1150 family protein [Alphaproteobacteria bacterium]
MRTQWQQSRDISQEALAALGTNDIAYVKPEHHDGQTIHVVYSADGQQIGGFEGRDVAFAACRQHELEPVSVH